MLDEAIEYLKQLQLQVQVCISFIYCTLGPTLTLIFTFYNTTTLFSAHHQYSILNIYEALTHTPVSYKAPKLI